MDQHFVVVQSKEDYDREQAEKNIGDVKTLKWFLKIVWWIFCSFIFSSIFEPFVSIETFAFILFAFIVLFAVADLTSNRKLRGYIRASFAFLFGFWGIAIIIGGIIIFFMTKDNSGLLLVPFGSLFLYFGYKNLKKYTRLVDKIYHR